MIKRFVLLLLILIPFATAQTAIQPPQQELPTCDQVALFTKITQEHQLTRKFMVDTYNEKSQLFFNEADRRLKELESEYTKQLHSAIFTLGFLWLFIAILVNALFGFLTIWLKQREHKKLKKDIANETLKQIRAEIEKKTQLNVVKERPTMEIKEQLPTPPVPPKMKEDMTLEQLYEKMKETQ